MSAFTKLNKQDAFVVPYTAHRSFSVQSTKNSGSLETTFYLGTKATSSLFSTADSTSNSEYERLVFDSVNHLYYSNFVTASYQSGSFENYSQTTLHHSRSISHTEGEHVFVFSISRNRTSEALNPGTFNFYSSSFKITDNSEGVLTVSSSVSLTAIISSSVDTVTVYDDQSENLNIDIVSSTSDVLKVDPSGLFTTHYLTKFEYSGSDNTSPLIIDGATRVTELTGSYLSTFVSFITAQEVKSSGTPKVSFDTGVTPDAPLIVYWQSASLQTTSVDHLLAQSQSLAAGEVIGNVFYPHGLAVVTDSNLAAHMWYAEQYSSSFSFENTHTVFEHQYRCRVKENEFNYSQNPSIKSGSNGDIYDFATGSYFQPYITTIGLYNDANELIAVGKLAQPVPKSRYTDMTFVVKFDS